MLSFYYYVTQMHIVYARFPFSVSDHTAEDRSQSFCKRLPGQL